MSYDVETIKKPSLPSILPCFRCKSEAKLHVAVGPHPKRYSVTCTNKKCGAHTKFRFCFPEQAITVWNQIVLKEA